LTMTSRQLALAGVSQKIAASRLPGAIAPAEGLPSPTFRYAGGMFSRPPKELLKDLIRSVFNVAAIIGAIKLAAWLLNPHPVLTVLSVKFGVWLMPLSLGGGFIMHGGWLSAVSHP